MLQIACPWCGVRDEDEFRYGGEADVVRPSLDADAERWGDYLFNRTNARGPQRERWLHLYGCNRWFVAERDTHTHELRVPGATGSGA
jgi:sarcosine oxidase subunit delta